jgi:hypothetical protein
MVHFLIVLALIAALWATIPFVYRLFGRKDYATIARSLDRDGAHAMLERHIRQMALSLVMPEHFQSGGRDAEAAVAAMTRILEIEGETRSPEDVHAFVLELARRRSETMVKDDNYPIVLDDMWPL